jgi:hypothetical protein
LALKTTAPDFTSQGLHQINCDAFYFRFEQLTGITDAQVIELAKGEISLPSTRDGAKLVADKAALLTKALAEKVRKR